MTDVFKGATDQTIFVELVDSTTGLPKTAIVFGDVTGSYSRTRSARVAITMATLASAAAAHSNGGFILVDDTNQPGVYRVDIPDAAFATGAAEVVCTFKATGCRTVSRSINLVNINNQVAYAPNAAADAAGGLPISDVGGLDLDSKLANTNEVTAARMAALTDWTNGGRLDLILDIVAADVVNIDGAAMRGTDSAALAATALSTTQWTNALATNIGTTNTSVAAILIDTGTDIPALIDALPTAAENFTAVVTTALTESYAADGVAPTLAQALFLIQQCLTEFSITSTTTTVKKLDGSTTAATLTLNSATVPTAVTRAT